MPLPDLKVYDPSQSLAKGLQVRQMGIENQRADKRLGLAEQQFALAGREADVREMSLGARLKEIEMAEDKAAKESLVQELETDEVYNAQISNLVAGMDFDNPEQYQEKLGEGLDLIGAKAFDFYKRYYGDDQRASQKTQEIQKLALAEWGDPETAKEKLIGAGMLGKPEKGPYKVGELKDFKVGDQFVTREYMGSGIWEDRDTAPRYKPESTINVNTAKPPTGYRYNEEGTELEPIPGGPAAKQTPEQAAKTEMIKSAIKSSEDFSKMILDEDGSVDKTMVALMQANIPKTEGRTAKVLLRDSIEAKLRAESGAAVPDTEVKRAAQRFSPSILDNDNTVKLKIKLLNDFLNGALDIIDPTGQFSVKDTLDNVEQEINKIEESHLPTGIPDGSKRIGTKNGNPAYKTPGGKILVVK